VSARPNAQMRGPAGSSLCSNGYSGRCGHPFNKPENLIQQIGAGKTSVDAIPPKGH